MEFEWILLILVLISFVAAIITAAVCYFMVFYSPARKERTEDDYDLPPGEEYQPFYEDMIEWIKQSRATPHKKVEIKTFDGLTLRGRYYEHSPEAPIELMMHGYRGNLERDLNGGIFRALDIGHSVLVFDHRGAGKSDGHTLTFGINESRDARRWIDYIIENINPDAKIILSGVSMGAATAMIVSGFDNLPKNIVGIIADCGYTSAKDIIKKVMRDMKLPANILYPFARLSAIVFGGFDPEERSPIESMRNTRLPVIFFHGDTDDYVPCYMSEENFAACASEKKRLVITSGAGHGLCFPVDTESYLRELREFFEE